MKSLYSKDARVIKWQLITHTSLQDKNISLVGDRYSRTRIRNTFASLMMSIEASDSPSYWYDLSSNNEGRLCQLFVTRRDYFFIYLNKMWTHSSKSCS